MPILKEHPHLSKGKMRRITFNFGKLNNVVTDDVAAILELGWWANEAQNS